MATSTNSSVAPVVGDIRIDADMNGLGVHGWYVCTDANAPTWNSITVPKNVWEEKYNEAMKRIADELYEYWPDAYFDMVMRGIVDVNVRQ